MIGSRVACLIVLVEVAFFFNNEFFRSLLFSVYRIQLLHFSVSTARLSGKSKGKIKPDKIYYYTFIYDPQTVLRLPGRGSYAIDLLSSACRVPSMYVYIHEL